MHQMEEGKSLEQGRITTAMEGSFIKTTFRDYVRVIFQRKKFIVIPVIAIPLCLAIYAFVIADEIYRADNRIVVLDNKTNKPLLGNLSTTSDLGKRINTSVQRINSRSGMLQLIASIDYLAAKFPDSAEVQNKRLEILARKREVLEYRLTRINSRLANIETQPEYAADSSQKRRVSLDREDFEHDRRVSREQIKGLLDNIRRTDERIRAIAEQDAESQRLVERSEKEPGNTELRLLCEARKNRRLEDNARLDRLVDQYLGGIKIEIRGNSVSASFESGDPQLCKDIVDEALLRLEFENLSIKKQEVMSTTEILDEKIHEYEQRVAEKENALKGYRSLHILEASPDELNSDQLNEALLAQTVIARPDMPAPHILTQYREYLKELQDIQRQISELAAEYENLTAQFKDTPEFVNGSVLESIPEYVARLQNDLHAAEMERAKLMETMTEKHPHVEKVSDKIARLKEMLAGTERLQVTQVQRVKNPLYDETQSRLRQVDGKLAGLRAREKETAKNMEYYRQQAVKLPEIVAEHSRLARELGQDRNLLRNLLDRKSGAEITRALEVDSEEGMRFEKPDPTAMPLSPVKPNRRVLILLGLLLGGAAAAVLLFFVEYADRAVRGIADVKRHLGLPVLGTVPYFIRKSGGVKVTTAFNIRGAINCAIASALATILAISFFLDSDVSDFVKKQMGREMPVAGFRQHQAFPCMLTDWSIWETAPKKAETETTAGLQPPDAPDIEIEPGVFAAEENP